MKNNIKKYIPWIILLLLVISLGTWYYLSRRVSEEQLSQYESKIEEALDYEESRDFSMAMKRYYEAAEIIPQRVEAYDGIISVLIKKDKLKDAEEVIKQSAKPLSKDDRSTLYKKLGDEYYSRKLFDKAYEMYDAGSFLGVNNPGLELMLGKTYLNLGQVSEARGQFSKSVYTGKDLEEANLLLAYIDAIDNTDKAKSTLHSVSNSDEMEIYYEEFRKTLEDIDDDKKFNATKLARVYINNGYPYLAILVLEPLRGEIAEYLEGLYFLGRAYYDYGDYSKSIETLDGALTLGGMEGEIFWIKGRAYALTNNLENAINSYDSAVGYYSGETSVALVEEYFNFLVENSQLLKAEELVKSLLIAFPDEVYLNLLAVELNYILDEGAKVEFYLSNLEELREEVTFVRNDEKDFLKWRIATLIDVYERNIEDDSVEEEMSDIERYMNELFELDRYSPYYRYFLARIQILKGEKEMAIQSLEQAIEYDLDYSVTDQSLKLLSSLR
ncbi:MAG: seg [candidate division WS6 bacterium 36_33]|uniref:Seg n=1 Tax=candidate division WS6 bacterium 36_33 TaxID=1641388 RepID=A0A101GZ74_9BACT|nr:MAG: seg [candidate division WS6 bacterium 36_33]